jgi:hypothetical protein
MSGVTVITMTGNVYTVANGASAQASAVATGLLHAEVYGPETKTGEDDGRWLASVTNAEAVYLDDEVTVTAPAEESTPAAKPGSWA